MYELTKFFPDGSKKTAQYKTLRGVKCATTRHEKIWMKPHLMSDSGSNLLICKWLKLDSCEA